MSYIAYLFIVFFILGWSHGRRMRQRFHIYCTELADRSSRNHLPDKKQLPIASSQLLLLPAVQSVTHNRDFSIYKSIKICNILEHHIIVIFFSIFLTRTYEYIIRKTFIESSLCFPCAHRSKSMNSLWAAEDKHPTQQLKSKKALSKF